MSAGIDPVTAGRSPELDGELWVRDRLGRPLRDLRISVTDQCNFRCRYCMPRERFSPDHSFLSHERVLTFDEITGLVRILRSCGVRKVRLTGGEPLLRPQLHQLVRMLARIPGLEVTLITNGSLLARHARALAEAGLGRVTVSLDSLDESVFRETCDSRVPLGHVLRGIEVAAAAGLNPVKINVVVRRGVNDSEIVEMARFFKGSGHILRFIEYMDVGHSHGWRIDKVVSAEEILARLKREFDLEPLEPAYRGEVARGWRYADGDGEIGLIASISQPFCCDCTRARLSADGMLYTCLFAGAGRNLRTLLRRGCSDGQIVEMVRSAWNFRDDRYSEIRSFDLRPRSRIEMSYIGG